MVWCGWVSEGEQESDEGSFQGKEEVGEAGGEVVVG